MLRRAIAALVVGAVALAPGLAPAAPAPEGFFVVSFTDRILPRDRAALEGTGVAVVDYEPDDSYIVWGDAAQIDSVRGTERVSAVGPLPVARKVDPALAGRRGGIPYAEITVFGPRLADAVTFLRTVGDVAHVWRARADDLASTVGMPLPSGALARVARHPAVLYVNAASPRAAPEDEMGSQIVAGNLLDDDNRPVPGYAEWLERVRVTGEGVTVAVVDTGVQENHPDLAGRVEKIDYSSLSEPIDTLGHGTHVAGIVGGAPQSPLTLRDPDGFAYGIGVAPDVTFVDQNAIGVTAPFPPREGFQTLSADAWAAGARMWNASWHTGEGSRSGYLASVRAMDEISRNADFDRRGRQEFLLVFSAGNAGQQGPTVPKEAKNIISVGATNSGRGALWPLSSNVDAVANFSSRGPTLDERIFPVVSAPGANVMSARAPEGGLTAAACVAPPDGALLYASCSGTSMAAPHVAGASALIHEWHQRRTGRVPSPALVRALLVNSATDIGEVPIPNHDEGWGRINLGDLFARGPRRMVDQTAVFTRRGQQRSYRVRATDPSRPLKVTLAWSDAPAAVGAEKTLVNDLDLVVEQLDGGRVVRRWLGNHFRDGWSAPGGRPDRLHNLENVYLRRPAPGEYRITVRAFNVPGDGIPQNRTRTDQDFALVIRGAS